MPSNKTRRTLGDDFTEDQLAIPAKSAKKENPLLVLIYPQPGGLPSEEMDAIVKAKTHTLAATGAENFAKQSGVAYYGFVKERTDMLSYAAMVPIWLNILAELFFNFQVRKAFVLEAIEKTKSDPRRIAVIETIGSTKEYHTLADYLGFYTWEEKPAEPTPIPEPPRKRRQPKRGSATLTKEEP